MIKIRFGIEDGSTLNCFNNILDKLKDKPSLNDLNDFINDIYPFLPDNIQQTFDETNFNVVERECKGSKYYNGYYIANKHIEEFDTPITENMIKEMEHNIENLPQPATQMDVNAEYEMKIDLSNLTNLYNCYRSLQQ